MRKRMFGLLAALALCLVLLPGTALAEDGGLVTITDNDGQSVTLAAGKYYVINNTLGGAKGGVTVQETAPTGKAYLTYAAGVLTVCGKEGNPDPIEIFGKMALSADLKMVFDSNAQASGTLILSWTVDSGPALSLNGHTLTLGKGMNFKVQSTDQPAVDGGTIRFTESSRGNKISIRSTNAKAVSGDLAVEHVEEVIVSAPPPVFEHLTVENCGIVNIFSSGQEFAPSDAAQKITSSAPLVLLMNSFLATDQLIMMPDHTVWANGGALSSGTHFIESDVTTPTAYQAGEGWALYTPGDTDTPAKLTLDGASYNGTINIQQANSVQLELKGENEVKSVNAIAMTLTGNGSFQGKLETQDFMNSSTAALNAVVCVTVLEEGTGIPESISQTVYGNRSTSDLSAREVIVQENSPLTITNGATLTVSQGDSINIFSLQSLTNHGTIVNEGELKIVPTTEGTPNLGTIVNNGRVVIPVEKDGSDEGIPAFIKALHLTGTGSVETCYTVQEGTNWVEKTKATYTNSGVKLFPPAGQGGTLDLGSASTPDESHWNDQGYKWEEVETDDNGEITSGKLTLAEGFNAETVILPQADVEIVTQGESTIGDLGVASGVSETRNLTFFGAGPLKIQRRVEISGNRSSLTVAAGGRVEVTGGVSVSDSGGVDGTIIVNGSLTANAAGEVAVVTGKVSVGPSGKLEVYGETGVQLGGMSTDSGGKDFFGAFSLASGGRFTGDCTVYIISACASNGAPFEEDIKEEDIIVIPNGYLPQGCEPEFSENRIELIIPGGSGPFNIGAGYVPPKPSHSHAWAEDWTTSATHHWHECAASGCPVTEDSGKKGYGGHVYDGDQDANCNVCGYVRTVTPPRPSEPSGSGGGGGGGGVYRGSVSYAVTVEKAEHGKVTPSRTLAESGSTVTLTVTPDSGYALDALTVTDSRGGEVKLTARSGGKYTFTMPERAVTVKAVFAPLPDGTKIPCDGGADCPSRSFADLGGVGTWYHEAVDFVLERGLMGGYGDGLFGPDNRLSRAQFTQILYNQAGRPAAGEASFMDVAPDAWCAPAIAWAAEQGVVSGYGGGLFGPDDPITREQLAVMLWRRAGSPAAPDGELAFADAEQIGAHAQEALRWAVQTGVMNGKAGGVLDPKGLATRAQAASMLKDFLENE